MEPAYSTREEHMGLGFVFMQIHIGQSTCHGITLPYLVNLLLGRRQQFLHYYRSPFAWCRKYFYMIHKEPQRTVRGEGNGKR